MAEQKIEIVQNGDYKNIRLKPNIKKGFKGLENGNHIVVEKLYDESRELQGKYGAFYSCGVKYMDNEVSFILNPKEHKKFDKVGEIGDKVKITLNKESFVHPKTGVEMLINRLSFEKV